MPQKHRHASKYECIIFCIFYNSADIRKVNMLALECHCLWAPLGVYSFSHKPVHICSAVKTQLYRCAVNTPSHTHCACTKSGLWDRVHVQRLSLFQILEKLHDLIKCSHSTTLLIVFNLEVFISPFFTSIYINLWKINSGALQRADNNGSVQLL